MAETAGTIDAVVIGAGFAGLYAAYRLERLGLSYVGIEQASGVGGTWWWNRYPGARCDVPSLEYSYSFDESLEQEWEWSEKYATQPEILSYLEHVADRFELRRNFRFSTRVISVEYDEGSSLWSVTTDGGGTIVARYVIAAVGCLSAGKFPEYPGIDEFDGEVYFTGLWPHEPVNFTGKRVAVIGTGSSGIQVIPKIAEQADRLTVFQRTPNFTLPARNSPLARDYVAEYRADYRQKRELAKTMFTGIIGSPGSQQALSVSKAERDARYKSCWQTGPLGCISTAYTDILTDLAANQTAADFVRDRIAEAVKDPGRAELLSPRSYPYGTKRLCLDTNYYETYNRDSVDLIDLKTEPIERFSSRGIVTQQCEREFDAIVFATGFDAVTGAFVRLGIAGRGGVGLGEHWNTGARAYLGLMSAGFPNLFMITGPGSPSIVSNVVSSIEQHVELAIACISHVEGTGGHEIEATAEAEGQWAEHVRTTANGTLYPQAPSWFMGANVPGKPRVILPYLGGVPQFRQRCDAVVAAGFTGFVVAPASAVQAGEVT